MTRRLTIMLIVLALLPLPAYATPSLVRGTNLAASRCAGDPGKLVINVVQDIDNDIDSGTGGNYWAQDFYNRQIQVWKIGTDGSLDLFCALVKYQGSFITVAGKSPGWAYDAVNISAGIEGTFDGGYRLQITGLLKTTPAFATRGKIGTFNYGCDPATGDCPGYVSWLGAYFEPGFTIPDYVYEWWGWIYRAGANGKWVNSADGNIGNIHD